MKFHNLSRAEIWVAGFSLAIGLFHVFLPGYAKAIYDWEYMQKYFQNKDLQEADPFAPTHDLNASLLSYRLMGICFMALVAFIILYS